MAGVWGLCPQRAEMHARGMGEQRESRAKGTYRKLVLGMQGHSGLFNYYVI